MPVVGQSYQDQNYGGEAIGQVLNLVLSGATAIKQGNRDKAYRNAFAKEMGIDPSSLEGMERADLNELRKEKYKALLNPKEYKPKDYDEALEFERAKAGAKSENDMKSNYGKYIANAEKVGNTPKSFTEFKKMFDETSAVSPVNEQTGIDEAKAAADRVLAEGVKNKPKGGVGEMLQKILGGVSQLGNNVKPMNPLEGFINMIRPPQGAVTSPVPTAVPSEVAQPGAVAPVEVAASQSPYPEYPDAVLENGVWKVIRAGKKYRLED